jgi:hypothetical protein
MPAVSAKQRRWAGWQLSKKRRGEATETNMTEEQLGDYARKPTTKDAARALRRR